MVLLDHKFVNERVKGRKKEFVKDMIDELRISIRDKKTYRKDYIYLVGDNALAKGRNIISTRFEYDWGKLLYANGVQVPEVYSLIEPDSGLTKILHAPHTINDWFVLMQRVKGIEVNNITGNLRKEATRLGVQELEKVIELGICPDDCSWGGNAIYGNDGKVYLIDYEKWRRGSAQDLNNFYARIKDPNFHFR